MRITGLVDDYFTRVKTCVNKTTRMCFVQSGCDFLENVGNVQSRISPARFPQIRPDNMSLNYKEFRFLFNEVECAKDEGVLES